MQKDVPAYDQPSRLIVKTQELLANSDKDLPTIYKDTGIPFYWLKSFMEGRYKKNPAINRVVFLYEYLKGSPLEV